MTQRHPQHAGTPTPSLPAEPQGSSRRAAHSAGPRRRLKPMIALGAATLLLGFGVVALADVLDDFGPPPPGDPSEFTGPVVGTARRRSTTWHGLLRPTRGPSTAVPPAARTTPSTTTRMDRDEASTPTARSTCPPAGRRARCSGLRSSPSRCCASRSSAPSGWPAARPLTTPFPSPTTGPEPEQDPDSVAASNPAGAALEAFLERPGHLPRSDRLRQHARREPLEAGDRVVPRSHAGPPAGRRSAAGQGLVPPAVERVPRRRSSSRPPVRARGSTAARGTSRQLHGYSAGEFGPGGLYHDVSTTTGRRHDRQRSRRHHQRTAGALPPAHADPGPPGPVDLRRHLPAQAAHGALRRGDADAPLQRRCRSIPPPTAVSASAYHHHPRTQRPHRRPRATATPTPSSSPGSTMTIAGRCSSPATTPSTPTPPTRERPSPARRERPSSSTTTEPGVKTCDANGRIQIRGDWRETMSTHWFHDHMLDFTAQNVYKGNAVDDELLQRHRSRQRGLQRRRQSALPQRHGARLGQPRL